jgi:hypothetical protein
MDIKKARDLLGEENKKYTDDQVLNFIETAKLFADIAIEKIKKMTPKELRNFSKKTK